jgi:predicted amidophosphoribosyltransferase
VPDPLFFCDNCGAEVPRDDEICPKCGRHFASVLCPACGFIGEISKFKGGCPACGYSTSKPPLNAKRQKKFAESKKAATPLPFWVYILTAAAFTAILAALFSVAAK